MLDKQRTFGQYDTPPDVADLLLAFCFRRPADRLLDPSCGTGAFLARAAVMGQWMSPGAEAAEQLWGVELDPAVAAQAKQKLPKAQILGGNYFALSVEETGLFDAVVGNPPYTRAEWIEQLNNAALLVEQLSIFADQGGGALLPAQEQGRILNRRAGLHAHFLVHSASFLRDGGRLGFVVPNSWLDVAYGKRLKQFLLDHFKIVALIESNVERWFSQASVNTCLLLLERCKDGEARQSNRVRLVRLRRPLAQLLPFNVDDEQRWSRLESLSARLLPGNDLTSTDLAVRVVNQQELPAGEKWGVALRAPAVQRRTATRAWQSLSKWAAVQRGFTTGANAFFYLSPADIDQWSIEPAFHRPLLKSLRQVNNYRVSEADCVQRVLAVSPAEDLTGTAAAGYIAWGKSQGYDTRRTCRGRPRWYSLPEQQPAHIVLAKGIWERHFAPLLVDDVLVDQQLYRLQIDASLPVEAAAAVLNSAWFGLQLELHGRVNFGEGVLWLAAYELEALRLPDLRYLPSQQLAELSERFMALLLETVESVWQAWQRPAQRALDDTVFAVLGLSAAEGQEVISALQERVATRQAKARVVAHAR
jgi:methylase of polypeptide subunit release factors